MSLDQVLQLLQWLRGRGSRFILIHGNLPTKVEVNSKGKGVRVEQLGRLSGFNWKKANIPAGAQIQIIGQQGREIIEAT